MSIWLIVHETFAAHARRKCALVHGVHGIWLVGHDCVIRFVLPDV